MSDISQKILIEVNYKNEQAVAAVNNFKVANDEATAATNKAADAINNLKIAEQQARANTASNREEISKLALAHKQATEETRKAKVAVDALPGSYNAAQKSLSELGKAIKSAEGGFKSTSPAIQAQIKEYNKLNTELKSFDAQLGNHQRNVGNYMQLLDKLIPGFGKFNEVLQTATQSFNVMGVSAKAGGEEAAEGAEVAEVAITSLGAAAGVVIGVLAAVVAGIALETSYLLSFEKNADKVSKAWTGLKAAGTAAMATFNGDGVAQSGSQWADLAANITLAFTEAKNAQGSILELNREIKISGVLSADENNRIRKDMLIIRNVKSGEIEVEKAYQDALKLTTQQYDRNKEQQDKLHEATVRKAIAAFHLNKQEVDGLKDIKNGYAGILAVAQKLTATDKVQAGLLEDMIASAQKGVEIEGTQSIREQMIQNRDDQKRAKLEKARQNGLTKAQHEADELAKIKEATAQSESERIASITRTLDFQREAFGKELSDTEEHYRQLIFKQQEFITKQQVIVDSKKSTVAEKSAAKNAIGVGNKTISTITSEKYAAIAKATIDHNRLMSETVARGALEIRGIEIQNIKDSEKRELAGIDNTFKEKILEYTKKSAQYEENIRKLNSEISKTKNATELYSLKVALQANQDLLGQNADAIVALEKKKQVEIQHTTEQYRIQNKLIEDEIALLADKKGGAANPFSARDKKTEGDQVQKVLDQAAVELNQVGLTENQKKLIIAKAENEIDAIHREHKQARLKEEVKFAELVSNTGLNILQQSLQRSAQAEQTYMELNKAKELQNSSLTATQKTVINEKYRIKEGQAKVKEFKQEQKLSIAKAVINGALAILKTTSELGWPASLIGDAFIVAETAAEIAVIASQKPPAYAGGGLHYQSDGRGSLLHGPGSGKSDSMNARLSNGEIIINERSSSLFKPLLSAINVAGGGVPFDTAPSVSWFPPGFATGGLFNSYTPSSDNGLRPTPLINTTARIHPNDIVNIVNAIGNIPAPIVDIKDVNYEQGKLASTQDRASYQ